MCRLESESTSSAVRLLLGSHQAAVWTYVGAGVENIVRSPLAVALVIAASAARFTQSTAPATIYEGARLIVGDASAPIENGAFVVQSGRITAIGRKGAVAAPAGADTRRPDRARR